MSLLNTSNVAAVTIFKFYSTLMKIKLPKGCWTAVLEHQLKQISIVNRDEHAMDCLGMSVGRKRTTIV